MIEPAVCVPSASGAKPAATAAADPADEPPGVCPAWCGWRVIEPASCWPVRSSPSCRAARPRPRAPAQRRRRRPWHMAGVDRRAVFGGDAGRVDDSFTAIGSPCSGPASPPRRSMARALRSAASASNQAQAPSALPASALRSISAAASVSACSSCVASALCRRTALQRCSGSVTVRQLVSWAFVAGEQINARLVAGAYPERRSIRDRVAVALVFEHRRLELDLLQPQARDDLFFLPKGLAVDDDKATRRMLRVDRAADRQRRQFAPQLVGQFGERMAPAARARQALGWPRPWTWPARARRRRPRALTCVATRASWRRSALALRPHRAAARQSAAAAPRSALAGARQARFRCPAAPYPRLLRCRPARRCARPAARPPVRAARPTVRPRSTAAAWPGAAGRHRPTPAAPAAHAVRERCRDRVRRRPCVAHRGCRTSVLAYRCACSRGSSTPAARLSCIKVIGPASPSALSPCAD